MTDETYPRANARALAYAAIVGSTLGLGLAAAYMAGVNSTSGLLHIHARQLASAEAQGFSESALQKAGGLAPGALAIAERHDPFTVAGAPQRDRQSADFAARLDSTDHAPLGVTAASLMLRPQLGPEGDNAASRLRFAAIGALDGARDLDCLTQAVYYEARGESAKGQAAVAQVVLNRVRSPVFPKTICAVVFQGAGDRKVDCQFSFVCDGSMREARDDGAWDEAQHVAARALSGVTLADVGNATHFHAVSVGQPWGAGLVRVTQVGMHVFYKFNRAHGPSPAQVFQASVRKADASAPQIKPVLASLLPPPASEASEVRADVKDAAADAPKPIIATVKADAPNA